MNFSLVTNSTLYIKTQGLLQNAADPYVMDTGIVTHVLVNDSTTGYGIFIENMLDAAS